MTANVFASLARYATRQEENFLTEAFVYLLNLILEKEAEAGKGILGNICGEICFSWFSTNEQLSITTQITITNGRPDIVIEIGKDKVVFIEVKHDSIIGEDQLERYYAYLQSSHQKQKQLVLLTRSKSSLQETKLGKDKFHHVCWYEISGWLSEVKLKDQTIKYLVQQFLEFLKEKDMSMEKVTWEYIQGVPTMINFLNMLGTAIYEANPEIGVKKTIGWSWAGYYLDGGIFLGFRFDNHMLLSFENDTGNNPTFKRELGLEQAHFFSLSAGKQLECLIDFIDKSLEEYKESHPSVNEQ